MTCSQAQCQREWHKKKCAEWNRKNTDYFKSNYLQKKIDTATQSRGDSEATVSEKHLDKVPARRMNTGMPLEYFKEVIGVQLVIIHEYMATRDSLIEKDLVAFDGTLFQVLDLPQKHPDQQKREDRSPVKQLIQQTIKGI